VPRPILLANELGDGLGHLEKLLVVARAVADLGPPVLAVPAPELVPPVPFALRRTPHLERCQDGPPSTNLGDVLARAGFTLSPVAARMRAEWDALLDELQPALIVTDYAPFVALAAHGRFPHVALGTGFTQPPAHLPGFPEFFGDAVVVHAGVQAAIGPLPAPALLAGDRQFVCVVPELDVFAGLRRTPAAGPLAPPPPRRPPREQTFVAYLSADADGYLEVLAALVRSGRTGRVHVRGGDPALATLLAGTAVTLSAGPLRLERAISESALVVHHGGANTAQQALLAGRPQLIVPSHIEQVLNGQELAGLGVARLVRRGEATVAELGREVEAMSEVGSPWAARALARAHNLARQYRRGCAGEVVAAVSSLLLD
jgi:rhamnosyltransferase subunit B